MVNPNNEKRSRQPDDGKEKELNLTNSDATLANNLMRQPDTPFISDHAASAASDHLSQSAMKGYEINPEYANTAAPAFETLH